MATDLATSSDPTADLLRPAALHAALIFVPLVVVAVLVTPWWLAVPAAAVVAVAVTVVRARRTDERVAARLGARPADASAHPRFAGLVESMSMAVGVAPPRLFVIDDEGANAVVWSSGAGPASIAATTGLLDTAGRIELEAVVAHLLSAVHDGAVVAPTVAAALLDRLATGPSARLVAAVVHAGADDRRVVLADLEGVRATQYPPGAVAALERLAGSTTTVARRPRALQPLWLAAPVDSAPDDLFAVHPPLADRIDLLREL